MALATTMGIKLVADVSNLERGMSRGAQAAQKAAASMERSFEQSARRIQASLRGAADALNSFGTKMSLGVTAPIAGFIGAALKGAMTNEQLEVSFTTMLGSAEKARKMMADLSTFAASTPFETPEIQNASKMLLAFGVETENIIPTMTTLGDIAAGLNIPLGDLAYLFGTTRASGRLMTADLNQFTSRGIPMIAALAETLGIAESEVKGFVEAGKVGFPEVQAALQALTSDGGQFAGLMEAQSRTLAGLLSTFSDNIGLAMTAIGKQMIESFDLKGILDRLNQGLGRASQAVINFAQTQPRLFKLIATFALIAAAIGPAAIGLGAVLGVLANLAPLLPVVAAGFGLIVGPVGLVVAALAALVAFDVGGIRTRMGLVVESFQEFFGISNQAEQQAIKMGASVSRMSPAMQRLQQAIRPAIELWDRWRDAVARAEGATGRMQAAVQQERFVRLPDPALIDRVAAGFVRVRSALEGLMRGDTSGIESIFQSLRDAIANIDLPTISEVWEAAKIKVTTVVTNFTWDVPGEVFSKLKTAIMDKLRSMFEGLFGGGGPLKGVESRNLPDFGMRGEFSLNMGMRGETAKGIETGLKAWIMKQIGSIDWSTLGGEAAAGAGNVFDGIKGFVQDQFAAIDWATLGGVGKGAQNAFQPIKDWVGEQLGSVDWSSMPETSLTALQTGAKTLKGLVLDTIANTEISLDPTQMTNLQGTLDKVKPIFDQLFGPEGIVTTINATINEAMGAVGDRLSQADGKEVGRQFSLALTDITSVFTLFESMKIEGQGERVSALTTLATDTLNFLSEFASGIDAEAIAASVGGATTALADALAAPLDAETLKGVGAAAGKFVGNILSKIGEVLGTPGFGEDVGESAGKTVGTLAKGAMSLATGIVTELGKVEWGALSMNLTSFVSGFIGGVASGLAGADMGPVAAALLTAITNQMQKSLPSEGSPGMFFGTDLSTLSRRPGAEGENPLLDASWGDVGQAIVDHLKASGDAWVEVGTKVGGAIVSHLQASADAWGQIGTKIGEGVQGLLGNLFGGGAGLGDASLASVVTGALGGNNPLQNLQAPDWKTLLNFPTIEWPGWASFISWPTIDWPGWTSFIKWPSISWPGWSSLIKWPTIPSFPGWAAILSALTGGGATEPATNAAGTSYFRGGLTWVGEQGPELMRLPRGTRIWSNRKSEAMASQPVTINVQQMTVRTDDDIRRVAYELYDLQRRERARRN